MITLREEKMNDIFTKHYLQGLDVEGSFNIFTGVDLAEDFHDHNFDFRSQIVKGSYIEEVLHIAPNGQHWITTVTHSEGSTHIVKAGTIHRLIALPQGKYTTLMTRLSEDKTKSAFYRIAFNGVQRRYWDEADFSPYIK